MWADSTLAHYQAFLWRREGEKEEGREGGRMGEKEEETEGGEGEKQKGERETKTDTEALRQRYLC